MLNQMLLRLTEGRILKVVKEFVKPVNVAWALIALFCSTPQVSDATAFYVNDVSTNGDVYTTAVGNDVNSGLSVSAPKLTLTNLLSVYTLSPGDTVYVDTGLYTNYTVTITNAGTAQNPISFFGSTNIVAGGSVIDRKSASAEGVYLFGAKYVNMKDFTVRGSRYGVYVRGATSIFLESLTAVSNTTGFYIQSSQSTRLFRPVSAFNNNGIVNQIGTETRLDYGILWNNTTAINTSGTQSYSLSNSVVAGGTAFAGRLPELGSDYNVFWNITFGLSFDDLSDLVSRGGVFRSSTVADPMFANPAGLDFHPQSVVGRYDPIAAMWVTDSVHSALIDLASPRDSFVSEPSPNGGVANVGRYGNHPEASLSRTNPWIFALSFNDGGNLISTGILSWAYGAIPSTSRVNLAYSPDAGTTWSPIVNSVPITNRFYTWNANAATSSLLTLWRVSVEGSGVEDRNDKLFTLRSSNSVAFSLYVNDTSTVNDVYSSVIGKTNNTGLSASSPRLSVQSILDDYDLGGGDTVYIDTGVYTEGFVLRSKNHGDWGKPMRVVGSTNLYGTTIRPTNINSDAILFESGASYMAIEDIFVDRVTRGIFSSAQNESNTILRFTVRGATDAGIRLHYGTSWRIMNSTLYGNKVGLFFQSNPSDLLMSQTVLWSNTSAFTFTSGSILKLQNSIIGNSGVVFSGAYATNMDYNIFWNAPMGSVPNLYELQKNQGIALHSTYADPRFVDPSNLNFHVRSKAGRWNQDTQTIVTDAVHSSSIDFGDPLADYSQEPLPNGGRVNAGRFGNTALAARSDTNAWLLATSLNDGGLLSVGDFVRWSSGNLASNATVRIEYSGDNGVSWDVVATNINAAAETYTWDNTNYPSSYFGRYRIVLESQPSVLSSNSAAFTFRNGVFVYYVNDDSLNGDVFTTAIGNDENAGTTPAAPRYDLAKVFDDFDLEPGDVVYIDTGVYRFSTVPQIGAPDSGSATDPVHLIFSPNKGAGGAVLDRKTRSPTVDGLRFVPGASHIEVRNLVVTNAGTGIRITGSTNILIRNAAIHHVGDAGLWLSNAVSIRVENSASYLNASNGLFSANGMDVRVKDSVFWRNNDAQVRLRSGALSLSGSVLVASTPASAAYQVSTLTNISANYNSIYVESNAALARVTSVVNPIDHLGAWQYYSGQDSMSLGADPRLASPLDGDFHLRSSVSAGRYDPLLGDWVTDVDHSPLIDAGDPARGVANEPMPNGGRVNIGLYAGSSEASLGRVTPWLYAASMELGGWVKGTVVLHWVSGNLPSNSQVRLEFSPNGGESWTILTTGIAVNAESFAWDTTTTSDAAAALWRVTSLADTNIWGKSTRYFGIRNSGPLKFYLNDADTMGDNFSTGPGAPTNWVATAERPLSSLSQLSSLYDLEPGDVVYVDVGSYSELANVQLGAWQGGISSNPVLFLGPTNGRIARVSRGSFDASAVGLDIQNVAWLAVSNVAFEGANVGVRVSSSENLTLSVFANANASNGVEVLHSTNIVFQRTVSARNGWRGMYLLTNTLVSLNQSVVWSNRGGAIQFRVGELRVSNSVLHSARPDSFLYIADRTNDTLRSDYNDMLAVGGAQVGLIAGRAYRYLSNWQQGTGAGLFSLSHDPLFANPDADDYHVQSQAGRFTADSGWIEDSQTSPLIDAGAPDQDFTSETEPNGARLNMGLFGNHEQASRSPTNGRLIAVTYNDGGSVRGTNRLVWVAHGAATSGTVRLEFSADSGNNWTTIVSGVNASLGVYTNWDTTVHGSTPRGMWRVVSESNTNILDATDNAFVVNNGALTYYVNDENTEGDVYSQAPGSPVNDGASPLNPARTVQQILNRYVLNPGDRILVDTGVYSLGATITFDRSVVGATTNRILVQGSTNWTAGGTIFDAASVLRAISVVGASSLEIRDIRIKNARTGIYFSESTDCLIENATIVASEQYFREDVYGVDLMQSPNITIRRSSISGVTNASGLGAAIRLNQSPSFKWLDGVLWSNQVGVTLIRSTLQTSNSVFGAHAPGAQIFIIGQDSAVSANYNNYFMTNGASMGRSSSELLPPNRLSIVTRYDSLATWSRLTGSDQNSLSADPLFVDPDNEDYHLMSSGGRFDSVSGWVYDAISSPLIDAGAPNAEFIEEPQPNGSRKNIGRYGNTPQASRTPSVGQLTPIAFNDGGVASGTNVTLSWVAMGQATNHPLSIFISDNDGSSWYPMATNIPANVRTARWDTTSWNTQPYIRWRVQSNIDPGISATNKYWFHIRNSNMVYYVNDPATNGDVYTTAAGYDLFDGLSPARPLPSLMDVVERYDLEPGDLVYVDTGIYAGTQRAVLTSLDSGANETNLLKIVGSTNAAAGGSVFLSAIRFDGARDVRVENVNISPSLPNDPYAFYVSASSNIQARSISVFGSRGNGFDIESSGNVLLDRSIASGSATNGIFDNKSFGVTWRSGVLWSNRVGVRSASQSGDDRQLRVSNSIIGAVAAGQTAIASADSYTADYNAIHVTNGALIARLSVQGRQYPIEYSSLGRWALDSGFDQHSLAIDPLFASAGRDYHLLSSAGRYDPGSDSFILDVKTSWLIDAGDPSMPYAEEPLPNGGRRNIGLYGNSLEASKSPTNAELLAVTLRDGGIALGTNQPLYWLARGDAAGHTVRIEYSPDFGLTWTTLASGVAASTGGISWNTTNTPSSALGIWRVVSENDASIIGQTPSPFAVRNGPVTFYINDGSTNGDLYCSAIGSDLNFGVSPAAPMRSLQRLLDTYDLEPGDVVYIDTGSYSNATPIRIGQGDSGDWSTAELVQIIGSTNLLAGGTVFYAPGTSLNTLEFFDAEGVTLKNLHFSGNPQAHIAIVDSKGIRFEGIYAQGANSGLTISKSVNIYGRNNIFHKYRDNGIAASGSEVSWDSGVLWSAGSNAVQLVQSTLGISNTVVGVLSSNSVVYGLDDLSVLSSEYNAFYLTGDATMARKVYPPTTRPQVLLPMRWENVSRWSRDTGRDRMSLSGDPLFVDPDAGDFHLKSAAGRFDQNSGTFVSDIQTSPLIDAGSPSSNYGKESFPNGARINIGAYGNTPWASRSSVQPALQVVSLSDGGRAEGSAQPLYWIAYGDATNHTVRIEVSTDGADSWTSIQEGLPARISSPVFWNTTEAESSARAYWRVVSESNALISSTSREQFAIRNTPLSFYVNDASTSGDVYSAVAGSPMQHGASPNQPVDSLQTILDTYDLEPGDTVYVDTGVYPLVGMGIRWGRFDAWDMMTNTTSLLSGFSVRLQGSTNYAAGGTEFTAYQASPAFLFSETMGLSVRDIILRQLTPSVGTNFLLMASSYSKFYRVEARNGESGFLVSDSLSVIFSNSVARGNSRVGLDTFTSGNTRWYNGLLWSNAYGVLQRDLSTNALIIENTAIGVWGSGSYAFFQRRGNFGRDGVLQSDYNSVYRNNGGFVAAVTLPSSLGGGTTRYEKASAWVNATGNDAHTLLGYPLFAGLDDFHPQSYAGRYVVGSGYETNLSDGYSPLIDAGRPGSSFAQEPIPNGGRVNIGPYGNTREASKTSTSDGLLRAITFNDGGSGLGVIQLYWNASGIATGHLVNLEFSSNGGGTWTPIVMGIQASLGTYTWDSESYGRAAAGLWRITSADNPAITHTTETFFSLRNGGSIPYYVNDSSLLGDVYCTAPGNDFNDGYLPSSPKATLQALLDDIDLEPGDIVYVDTGTYLLSAAVEVGDLDAGTLDEPVVIQGSTNQIAGGTVFNRQTGSGTAIRFKQTEAVHLRDVRIINSGIGVELAGAANIRVVNVRTENAGVSAFFVQQASSSEFVRCTAYMGSNGVSVAQGAINWNNGVIYGVQNPFVLSAGGSIDLRNSYTRALGADSRIFKLLEGAGTVTGDYNSYQRDDNALMFERVRSTGGNEFQPKLSDWQAAYTQDLHSLSHSPMLVNPDGGDFTPRSASGRFLPDGSVAYDPGVFSPLIDTGDPSFTWTNEAAPNGHRINIGHLGNTASASLSQTNPWLLALSYNDGGMIRGTVTVYWASGGMTNGARVRLEQALDGVDFSVFSSNIPASQGSASWNVSHLPVSYQARWRVVCEDCDAESQNETPVTIKNQTLTIYINDADTSGDVYTTAPGSSTNTGLSANQPLNSPEAAFARYILGPEDTVYIDTGIYPLTNENGLVVGLSGSTMENGLSNYPIRVIGSTNYLFGGSLIVGVDSTNSYALQVKNSAFVEFEHLRLSGAGYGMGIFSSPNIVLRNLELFDNKMDGLYINNQASVFANRLVAWRNGQYGARAANRSELAMNHSVFWSNRLGGVHLRTATLGATNSIVVANATNTYGITYADVQSRFIGDHNIFWATNAALIAYDQGRRVPYRSLRAMQTAFSSDEHSAFLNPQFAAPEIGDFHLQSAAGRYTGSGWVTDLTTSWAIDAGAPTAAYDKEAMPNGERLNAGMYGNTYEASLSVTNPLDRKIRIISFNDGGLMSTEQFLRWMVRGFHASDLLTLEYSPNNGLEWRMIAVNVPATAGEYYWSPDPTNSSPITLWRISTQSGPPQTVTNDKSFALRLQPIKFYVNDGSQVGDVYSQAVGSPTNDGLTVFTPLDSLATILRAYDMEPGDQVLVDTGYYMETNTVEFTSINAGSTNVRVYITGSTNWQFGGSLLNHASAHMGSQTNNDSIFDFYFTHDVDISYFTVVSANVAVALFQSKDIVVSNLVVRDAGMGGISLGNGSTALIRHSLITKVKGPAISAASANFTFESGIIWSNAGSAIVSLGGAVRVTNSILHATGTNFVYALGEGGQILADYNNLFLQGGARPALSMGLELEGLPQWTAFSGSDVHSLSVDPLFADPSALDFHLRSIHGRFDPQFEQFLTNDVQTSYMVDTGPPAYPYSLEPEPNGARRNMGIYGNTEFASKGRTNAWVMALTGNSGGRANGVFSLAWAWGQIDPTNRVSLDYSYDNGTNWIRIASNQAILNGTYIWDSTLDPMAISPIARFRVVLESDTNIWDMTDRPFALNGPFSFYLNDENLSDDVFTSATGSDANLGFYPQSPMRNLHTLLDVWDIDPGDSIYIDTGLYPIYSNTLVTLLSSDAGSSEDNVYLISSTNAGGVVFEWKEPPTGPIGPTIITLEGPYFVFTGARFRYGGIEAKGTNLYLHALSFTNASAKLGGVGTQATDLRVNVGNYETSGSNQRHDRIIIRNGTARLSGSDITMVNSLVYGTQTLAIAVGGTNIVFINNTVVGSRDAVALGGQDSSLTMRNNILVANGADAEGHVIRIDSGALDSDYNNLVARNGAWIGTAAGKWERLLYWQGASLQDMNSISVDPLFADETNGDFHVKSTTGRWTPGGVVVDVAHSSIIDMGSHAFAYNLEPSPNGGRINLGAYGNTEQASRSRTTPWVFAKTMNDGGVLKGTNITLRWAAGNLTNGATVTLRYSANGGVSWTTIASGIEAAMGEYVWDSTSNQSSFDARWAVVVDGNTNIYDVVDSPFNLRNVPQHFYVNDLNSSGDVYTTAPGNPLNSGLTPAAPMDTLLSLLRKYDTEGGDVIYVDTGTYAAPQSTTVIWSRGGDMTNGPLWIFGSTNFSAGGSKLSRGSWAQGAAALDIKASHVRARNLTLQNAMMGVLVDSNEYVTVERMRLTNNTVGVSIKNAFRPTIVNNVLANNLSNAVEIAGSVSNSVQNNVFYDNVTAAIAVYSNSSPSVFQNNIYSLGYPDSVVYTGILGVAVVDYNIYELRTNRTAFTGTETNLLRWQLQTGRDYRSAVTNPLFADPIAADFHLKSKAGRWVDGSGFVIDAQSSWAIDRGSTNTTYELEQMPNGARINIGAYGNTEYASKGLVNTQVLVETRVLNEPTHIGANNATWPLIWGTINVPTTELFRVEFSGDGGASWYTLSNNVPAYQEFIVWDATPFFNTHEGLWRVVGINDTNNWAVNKAQFDLFFGTFKVYQVFYDQITNGIVFRGAWNEQYQVQWSTNLRAGDIYWTNAVSGPGPQDKASFLSTNGGDFTFRDIESVTNRYRLYRVIQK